MTTGWLDIHLVAQAGLAAQVIPGYTRFDGPAIALPRMAHRMIPWRSGPYDRSARDLLAEDIRTLRHYTDTPNGAFQQLIQLYKTAYPGSFKR